MATHWIAVRVQTKDGGGVTTQNLIEEIASNLQSEWLNLEIVEGLNVVADAQGHGAIDPFYDVLRKTALMVTF